MCTHFYGLTQWTLGDLAHSSRENLDFQAGQLLRHLTSVSFSIFKLQSRKKVIYFRQIEVSLVLQYFPRPVLQVFLVFLRDMTRVVRIVMFIWACLSDFQIEGFVCNFLHLFVCSKIKNACAHEQYVTKYPRKDCANVGVDGAVYHHGKSMENV